MARTYTGVQPTGPAGLFARELLLAWLGLFAFLSIDVLIRIIGIRAQLESSLDAIALISIEGCRAATLLVAVWLAGVAFHGARRPRSARTCGVLIVFAAVWYARQFAFSGFPGRFQEALAGRLIGAGFSVSVLDFVFGAPQWSAWIALGALLRLSVTWPHALDPERVEASGRRDRKGMMRSVALAGADIGAAFRRLAATAIRGRWLDARALWPAVLFAGVFHSLMPWPSVQWIMTALLVVGASLAVTNLRAAFAHATRRQRNRIAWAATAAVVAGSAFLVAGILSLGGDPGSAVIGLTIASLAPIVVLVAVAALLRRDPPPAGLWLRRSVLAGTSSLTGATAYLLALTALPGAASPEIPVREIVAFITSVVLVLVSAPRLRAITGRITPSLPR